MLVLAHDDGVLDLDEVLLLGVLQLVQGGEGLVFSVVGHDDDGAHGSPG